jgi:hypothetical protein
MIHPTWTHALAVLAGTTLACALVTAAEQGLAWLVRRRLRTARPLLAEAPAVVCYERSLFTPGAADVRWVRAGLGLAGLGLWLGLAWHPLAYGAAGLVGLGALVLDIRGTQAVEVNAWQVAWQRGRRGEVRRLPLVQVAAVHAVQRPADGTWAGLAARLGIRLGSAYLALEFHNGRAVKLPRTDLRRGLARVQRVAAFIEQQLQAAEQTHRQALADELRARRRAFRLLPDAEQLAMRRELASLRQAHASHPARLPSPTLLVLEYDADDPATLG